MTKDSERAAGFGRDKELEGERLSERPAKSDLNATEAKAERRPTITYAPNPDGQLGGDVKRETRD